MGEPETTPVESSPLTDARVEELLAILEEIQQTADPARLDELLLQASKAKDALTDRTSVLDRIVAAGITRRMHNFGSLRNASSGEEHVDG